MLCAISGEQPQVPVASRKSGHVFEKRLIEDYISQHGTDPVNGEELTTDDLIELKTTRAVNPRPPTLTSIPSLLSAFQNEWDAIALETYTLKQQLAQTRQELSTALYEYDAALRVIARLQAERGEARDALSQVTVGAVAENGDEMEVDVPEELPQEIAAKVEATQTELSKTRRKRPVPEGWATADTIESFDSVQTTEAIYPGARALAINSTGAIVIVGGTEGVAGIYSLIEKKVIQALKVGGGSVTSALWWNSRPVVATSTGAIKVFEDVPSSSEGLQLGSHAGAVTAIALHPSGDILASVGVDKVYRLYDLTTMKVVSRILTDSELSCGEFHPDGHLFAAGSKGGQIRLYDVTSGEVAATFEGEGPIQALSFSENGIWLASASRGQTGVSVWDLRKAAVIHQVEIGSQVISAKWDYTGQFLAVAGPGCVAVQQYAKSSKKWSEPFRKAISAVSLTWGANAQSLVALTEEGALNVLGATS
ncbi:putative cell cycle control protein [Rhizodiscina lignyota]|uniref:Pre-mRNA-processing factor 19 n=1 Tax=Rhizodiscina lignyota TaxID=1504668 RepID=A0A9P4MBQ7_9PEZI|nr:putative cell cycle control protein [Rhizodiscina lignyota]